MPLPDDVTSSADRVSVIAFNGLNASRSVVENAEYNVGISAVNIGRKIRQPLHPRLGLRPVTSSNDNHVFSGACLSMGALAAGTAIHILVRLSGGRMIAARNVELV